MEIQEVINNKDNKEFILKAVKESGKLLEFASAQLQNDEEVVKEALKQEENDIVIDCVLHRFEFTFELAWKSMKDFLEYNGISENIGSPREILRRAFESHLIEDGEEWINMMLARNSLSHLYDEETSRKIYKEIKEKYIKLLEKLNNKFETLI